MSKAFDLRELDDLFQRAIALPSSNREEFIEHQCGSRRTLHGELRRMLEAHANAGQFLDCSLPSYLNGEQSFKRIGRWKLIEPVGEGGLGIVYRATCEADGVILQAAVKVLRDGFHKGVFQERFIQERSILSGLDHPYIARLIDAGAGSCGDSFLAVEFVNGCTLDRYLEEANPSLHDRLNIFTRICEAVEYLHSNRIVHGDIKPGNVMVKPDATPKLLDFGTARLIEAGNPESFVQLSRLIMTPGYASPEQTAGQGPSVRGDVYSLGCVLRDILTEVRTPGDLAAIGARCLSPLPVNRYASPGEIADDVQRYLKHFPVRAHRESHWYAASKFIRRNRIACALAVVAFVSVLTGSLLASYDARRAALSAREHRSLLTHLVGDQAGTQSPESIQRTALTGSIQDAIAQLERMKPLPVSDLASAWRRLSYIEAARGQTSQSLESIQRSIEYARRNSAANPSPAAQAGLADSLLYAAALHNRRGNTAKAGEFGIEAIRLVDMLPPENRSDLEKKPQFLHALLSAARQMSQKGDSQGGRGLLLRGLEKSRSLSKIVQLRLLLDLALFERRTGNADLAQSYCAEAKTLEPANPRLRNVCGQGAGSTTDTGKNESGLAQKAAILERRLVLDPENFADRQQLARLKLQLGRTVASTGDTARARKLVEEAQALAKPLLEADPKNRRLQFLARNTKRGAQALDPNGRTARSHIKGTTPIVR